MASVSSLRFQADCHPWRMATSLNGLLHTLHNSLGIKGVQTNDRKETILKMVYILIINIWLEPRILFFRCISDLSLFRKMSRSICVRQQPIIVVTIAKIFLAYDSVKPPPSRTDRQQVRCCPSPSCERDTVRAAVAIQPATYQLDVHTGSCVDYTGRRKNLL